MVAALVGGGAPSPRPSNEQIEQLTNFVRDTMGISLSTDKAGLTLLRLLHRTGEGGGADGLLDRLVCGASEAEREALTALVTTNVTSFFRQEHHFEMLRHLILPSLVARARAGGRVRIWSAGCSSGQEPYSIAAVLRRLCPEAPTLDVRVLATDIDQEVLLRARGGLFRPDEVAQISPSRQRMLFDDGSRPAFQVCPELMGMVEFLQLNLMEEWPMKRSIDVIFCRNVAMYFDPARREQLWQRFAGLLEDGGFLLVGHAERVLGPALYRLRHVGVTAYRKMAAGSRCSGVSVPE